MSLFAASEFLECLAEAFEPDRGLTPRVVTIDGRRYRVLVDGDGRPHAEMPYLDIVEPIDESIDESIGEALAVDSLHRVERDRIAIDDFDEATEVTSHYRGARFLPYVDWSEVDDFDSYVARCRKRNSRSFKETRNRPNKFERQLDAEITIRFEDDDPEHFDQCLAWKSAQYLATGPDDWLADGGNELFHALRDRGLLVTSTLLIGDRMVAAHIGYVSDGVFGYWMPSYDAEFSKYSPGNMLLCELLRTSHERGDREFDFLEGIEPYKFWYGTHIRRAGLVGEPPMIERAVGEARYRVSSFLQERPELRERALRLRDRLGDLRK